MERACIHRADALSAPSQDMADTIAKECGLDPGRIRIIPNALDTRPFVQAGQDRKLKEPREGLTVLHVGRLERVKGIETLARAIPQLVKQYPKTRFVFVGDDRPDGQGSTWRKRLEKDFQEQGVTTNVHLTGKVSQEELVNWYSQADLAVIPSELYESFSYTCAQAMAAGLPMIGSRIGGIPETVADCGLVIEPGNVKSLTESLLTLIRNDSLRQELGQEASLRAHAVFDAPIIAAQTIQFYKDQVS
jgi:hypothetical protein